MSKDFSIERVADLARLKTPSDPDFLEQFHRVLKFIAVLDELDLSNVEPFFGSDELTDGHQPIRNDEVISGLSREQVLQNAPNKDRVPPADKFFVVPPVFD